MSNKTNRREFLKVIGAASLGVAVSPLNVFAHLADWQDFMEGAVETGEAAAQSLIY